MAPALERLTLMALALAAFGCKKSVPPAPEVLPSPDAGTRPLTTLKLLWRLAGLEATQSLLTANPQGNTFLAVKQTGEHAWSLCAVEIRRGEVKWCSPLAQRADIALSIAGDKAVVHPASGNVAAYDLESGRLSWRLKLDCEIRPGRLRPIGEGLALAECLREGIAASEPGKPKLVAIELKDGKVRWQFAEGARHAGHYLLDGCLLVSLEREPVWRASARPPRRPPDRQHARGYRLFEGQHSPPLRLQVNARVGDKNSDWRILDLATGLPLPASSLRRKTGEDGTGDTVPVVARAAFHDPWSWMSPAGPIWRADRLFAAGCAEVYEIDPATKGRRQSWPLASDDSVPEPLLIALDVAGSRVTFVLGSRDDRETGRIVTFDGQRPISASRSPALDPDLLALTSDVLVVQEQVHLGLPGESPAPGTRRKPALAGYSLTGVRSEPLDADRSNTGRIRRLIASLGVPDQSLCSECETRLDARSTAALQAIPRWETLLSALLLDRSRRTQEAAFAAVKQMHTPALLQELIRLLGPKPTPGWSPWNREPGWWMAVAEKERSARLQAAMTLIELRHPPAIKPLTRLFRDAPVGDPHDPLGGRSFPTALCSWLGTSTLPEAKVAIAEYDRFFDAPGAWQARCDDLLRGPPTRPRRPR